ncbi:hypothetical protein ACWDYH_36680 [Nocardia goodfellowii]
MAASPRRSRSATAPTRAERVPSTLWAHRAFPLDSPDRWPAPILARAVTEFSEPGSTVLLLGWPAPTSRGALRVIEPDTVRALSAVAELDRHGLDTATGADGCAETVDLVIASLLGDHPDPGEAAEYVAALAVEVMALGGLLVVLSRCRHSDAGVLSDPAGSVVAAAQAADLLYLQHIIAAPVTGDAITAPAPAEPEVSSLARHRVAHTDVFVFLQPAHG